MNHTTITNSEKKGFQLTLNTKAKEKSFQNKDGKK